MMFRSIIKLSIFSAFVLGALFSCSQDQKSKEMDHAVLQLKWFYNAGFVGDFVAKEKGFWKEHGLEVAIRQGGIGINPIKVVITGDAHFGVATGDQLLLAAAEGIPIVAIALAYQDNPLAWIVRSNLDIHNAADFKGKKIGLTYIDDEALFNVMMDQVGLNPNKDLEVIPVKFDTSPFLRNEVDAFPVYRNTQAVEIGNVLTKEGIETNVVGPADHKIISYSNLYFVTEEFLEKQPKIVKKFVEGIIKGWEYAQENPEEAANIVSKYDTENPLTIIKESVISTNRLVKPSSEHRIGNMSKEGWQSTLDIMLRSNQLKSVIEIESIYNNQFVEAYYK